MYDRLKSNMEDGSTDSPLPALTTLFSDGSRSPVVSNRPTCHTFGTMGRIELYHIDQERRASKLSSDLILFLAMMWKLRSAMVEATRPPLLLRPDQIRHRDSLRPYLEKVRELGRGVSRLRVSVTKRKASVAEETKRVRHPINRLVAIKSFH